MRAARQARSCACGDLPGTPRYRTPDFPLSNSTLCHLQFGQGGTRAEVLAAKQANGSAAGGTGDCPTAAGVSSARLAQLTLSCPAAYVNLEPVHGLCAGDLSAVEALVGAGVMRVVVGLPHPLPRLRGCAIAALQAAGLAVDVMSADAAAADPALSAAWLAVLRVNEALLHRAVTGRPFSVWKYAMTLDGKIASSTGHSAWVTGPCVRVRGPSFFPLTPLRSSCRSYCPRAGVQRACSLGRRHHWRPDPAP